MKIKTDILTGQLPTAKEKLKMSKENESNLYEFPAQVQEPSFQYKLIVQF